LYTKATVAANPDFEKTFFPVHFDWTGQSLGITHCIDQPLDSGANKHVEVSPIETLLNLKFTVSVIDSSF
jgi:hypothetical protein